MHTFLNVRGPFDFGEDQLRERGSLPAVSYTHLDVYKRQYVLNVQLTFVGFIRGLTNVVASLLYPFTLPIPTFMTFSDVLQGVLFHFHCSLVLTGFSSVYN